MKYPSTSRYYETVSWYKMENALAATESQTPNTGILRPPLRGVTSPVGSKRTEIEWKNVLTSYESGSRGRQEEILETNTDKGISSEDGETKKEVESQNEVSPCLEDNSIQVKSEQPNHNSSANDTSHIPGTKTPLITIAAKSLQSHVSKQLVVLKKYLNQKLLDYVARSSNCYSACTCSQAVGPCSSGLHPDYPCSFQSDPCCINSCQTVCEQSCVPCTNLVCPCSCSTLPPSHKTLYNCPDNTNLTHNLETIRPYQRNQVSPPRQIKANNRNNCPSIERDSGLTDSFNSLSDQFSSRNYHGRCVKGLGRQTIRRHRQKPVNTVKAKELMFENENLVKCSTYYSVRQPVYDRASNSNIRAGNGKTFERKSHSSRNYSKWGTMHRGGIRNSSLSHRNHRHSFLEGKEIGHIEKSPFRVHFNSRQGMEFHCWSSRKGRNKRLFSMRQRQFRNPSVPSTFYDQQCGTNISRVDVTASLYDPEFNESPGYFQKGDSRRDARNGRKWKSRGEENYIKSVNFQTGNSDIFKISKADEAVKCVSPFSEEQIFSKTTALTEIPASVLGMENRELLATQPSFCEVGTYSRDVDRSRSKSFCRSISNYKQRSVYSDRQRACSYHAEDFRRVRKKSKKIIKMRIWRK